MITGMDRLVAAINGEKSDRIPVFCNIFDQGATELGISIKEYYSDGANVAEGQLKLREKYGYDNVWSLSYVGHEVEALGKQKVLYVNDGPPNIQDYIIKSYDDIEKLQVPDNLADHPGFAEQMKCQKILHNEVGGKYPIAAYITSTMGLPIMLMGMEKWFELLFTGPEDVRELLLEKCFEYFVKEIEMHKAAGVNALVYSNPFGSTDTVPMKYFMEYSLPWIERDANAVGAENLIYYCGMSRFNKVIETVLERQPFGTFYISPLDDVAEGKKAVDGRALTVGVVNDLQLLNWSKDEIRTNVKKIIDAGMPGGKFVFGGAATAFYTPEDTIHTMLDAAYEFGSY